MHALLHDLRHGVRLLRRAPGFSAVAVAALAIGIGANTAMFSVINALLIQPLPYPDADRLAIVWEHNIPRDNRSNVVSPGNFIHWREMNGAFEDLAAVSMTLPMTLTAGGEPEELRAQLVTTGFFPILQVQPALGRVFTSEENQPGSRVVVISDRLWRRRFNGDPSIIQRSITLQGLPNTVVGVMPPGFSFLDRTVDVWTPVGLPASARTPRGRSLTVVGRLEPNTSVESAQREMTRVHAELTRMFPDFNTGWTARVVPLREQLTGDVRPALLVLLGAVAFVLMIACANVANLLLARATSRQRELAVRAALGAGRGRLLRQMLAESAVLAVAGGAAGLALAWWALHLVRLGVADRLPIQRLDTVDIDLPVLGYTLAATIVSGIVFGLAPALTASGTNLQSPLKEGGRTGTGRGARARNAFVVIEIAVALVLLAGAGLLVRSFGRLLAVDRGFDTERTVTMRVSLPMSRYGETAQRVQFYQRLFERIDTLPGVRTSGGVSFLPLTGLGAATRFEVIGRPAPPPGAGAPVCDVRVFAHKYLETLGVPLVRGRLFVEHDAADAGGRIVINEKLATQYFPGEDPIGKRIRVNWNDPREDEIIGVVGDVRHNLEVEPRATIYWPYARFAYPSMTLTVNSALDAASVGRSVTAIVRELDPQLAVADVRTMDDVVSASVAQRRVTMMLLAIFAGVALLLAAVGIYGVIAYSVTQRTQEIGIRLALGAQRGNVLRLVVGQALLLTFVGVAIGAAGAFGLTRLMEGLLFDTRAADPLTFVVVSLILAAVAVLAAYVPGRRATRVDPVIALRSE